RRERPRCPPPRFLPKSGRRRQLTPRLVAAVGPGWRTRRLHRGRRRPPRRPGFAAPARGARQHTPAFLRCLVSAVMSCPERRGRAAPGTATITITSGDGSRGVRAAQITPLAPGLFSANADGQGVAAAVALRVKADGAQSYEPVAVLDQALKKFVARPLDLGSENEQLFLLFFGTGLRNHVKSEDVSVRIGNVDAPVLYAGAQGDFAGLDQLNVLVPRALVGRGEVALQFSVIGKTANPVRVAIK